MTETLPIWHSEADVIVIGYGFAGGTAAITAQAAGAKVLLLEKAPEADKGGNSRVSANLVFWPDDVDKAATYFKALAGPYLDNSSDAMVGVWAAEMHANKAWLEALGMTAFDLPYIEFPEMPGSECVKVLMNGPGPMGGERLWKVIEAAVVATVVVLEPASSLSLDPPQAPRTSTRTATTVAMRRVLGVWVRDFIR